jgi:hypothetical protein
MIDCNITKNYFNEKQRMTKKHKLYAGIYKCELDCSDCPLSSLNNDATDKMTCDKMTCGEFETLCPEQAIKVVQKWSDEHPQKTFLTEFLEKYPNAELDHGVPKVCLKKLGAVSGCAKTKKGDLYISCYRCWNQPIPAKGGEER